MPVEDNIDVVRRLAAAVTRRDWEAFDELLAEDFQWTDVPSGSTINSRDEPIAAYKRFTAAFPDFRVECVTLIGQGCLVASEWRGRGTHKGPLPRPDCGHYEPTGRSFERTGVGIVELRGRKIVNYRDYFDRQTLTDQLGLE